MLSNARKALLRTSRIKYRPYSARVLPALARTCIVQRRNMSDQQLFEVAYAMQSTEILQNVRGNVRLDATDSPVRTNSPECLESLDDFITQQLFESNENDDERSDISAAVKALERDPNCHFARVLIAFESLQFRKFDNRMRNECLEQLIVLERLLVQKELSKREALYASAAAFCLVGEYSLAGELLEDVLAQYPSDYLAMKWAIDCYCEVSHYRSALRAATRVIGGANAQGGHLDGIYLSLISRVYAELGRTREAVDVAERSVTATNRKVLSALSSLFTAFLLDGSPTSVQDVIDVCALNNFCLLPDVICLLSLESLESI